MHRFYVSPQQCHGAVMDLEERESHHAAQVLRLRCGDPVTVLNGAGSELLCRVQNVSRKAVSVAVVARREYPPLLCPITLLQGIPKGKLMESILQKATELGVNRVVPILADRSVTQLNPEEALDKGEKWRQVAIEAIKQCGSPWLPEVVPPVSVKTFLARGAVSELSLLASLQEDRRHVRDYFERFAKDHNRAPDSLSVWVGPEGDFSPEEIQLITSAGAKPITLGHLVLRSETAATCALSVLGSERDWLLGRR